MAAIELGSTSLLSKLTHYWKLENVNDAVGSANFTNNNSTTFTAAMFNNGANFGTSGNKTLSYQSDSIGYTGGAFSISIWVKLNQEISSGLYDIFDLVDASSSHTELAVNYQYNSGTPQLHFQRTTVGITTAEVVKTVTLGTSSFHNIILAYDGSTITAYLDGVSAGTVGATGTGNAGNTTGFVIGGQNNNLTANNGLFIGDDCGVFGGYNLTQADVTLINNAPSTTGGAFLLNFV